MSVVNSCHPIRILPGDEKEPQEKEPQEKEPQIGISFFRAGSRHQFIDTPMRFLGHHQRVNKLKERDWVLLYDLDTGEVFGISLLRVIENDRIYRDIHPFDTGIYPEEYKKYNKYEIGVKTVIITPTTKKSIMKAIGLSEHTQLWKGQATSFKRIIHDKIPTRIQSWIYQAIAEAWCRTP